MVRREVLLAAVIAVMVTIGLLFVVFTNLNEPDPVWDDLSWNIEEGDSFTYYLVSERYTELNDTYIVVNVTQLPNLLQSYSKAFFASSIIEMSKVEVLFENGSELGDRDYFVRMLLSQAILPCGEWDFLDSLYVNPEDASFGPSGDLEGYMSKLESDYFLLGHERVGFDSSSGWNAHISLETGLPFYIQRWLHDDFSTHTGYIQMSTRITLELFLCNSSHNFHDLSWNIEEGDTFSYRIISDYVFSALNDTLIITEIYQLPDLLVSFTSETFSSSVVEVRKVTILPSNESELVNNYADILSSYISKGILPCGDWQCIDEMYPDSGYEYGWTYYTSIHEDGYFVLSWIHRDDDSNKEWSAHISLETGVPFYIKYWRWDPFHEPAQWFEFELYLEE